MPFGLTNAPVYFMDLMNIVFRGIVNKIMVVFVDDILVFSKSVDEHGEHWREVLETLRKHKLKAKFLKYNFWKEEVKFLGHIVSGKGLSVDPSVNPVLNTRVTT